MDVVPLSRGMCRGFRRLLRGEGTDRRSASHRHMTTFRSYRRKARVRRRHNTAGPSPSRKTLGEEGSGDPESAALRSILRILFI